MQRLAQHAAHGAARLVLCQAVDGPHLRRCRQLALSSVADAQSGQGSIVGPPARSATSAPRVDHVGVLGSDSASDTASPDAASADPERHRGPVERPGRGGCWGVSLRLVSAVGASPVEPISGVPIAGDLLVGLAGTAGVAGAGGIAAVAGLEHTAGVGAGTFGVARSARPGRTDVDVTGCATLAAVGTDAAGTAGHRVAGGLGPVTQRGDLRRLVGDDAAALAAVDARATCDTGGRSAGLGTVAPGDDAGLAAVAAEPTRTGVTAVTAGDRAVRGPARVTGILAAADDDAACSVAALAPRSVGITAATSGGRAVREPTLTLGLQLTPAAVSAGATVAAGTTVTADRGRFEIVAADGAAGVVDDQIARTAGATGTGVAEPTGSALRGAGDGAAGSIRVGDSLTADTTLAAVLAATAVTTGDVGAGDFSAIGDDEATGTTSTAGGAAAAPVAAVTAGRGAVDDLAVTVSTVGGDGGRTTGCAGSAGVAARVAIAAGTAVAAGGFAFADAAAVGGGNQGLATGTAGATGTGAGAAFAAGTTVTTGRRAVGGAVVDLALTTGAAVTADRTAGAAGTTVPAVAAVRGAVGGVGAEQALNLGATAGTTVATGGAVRAVGAAVATVAGGCGPGHGSAGARGGLHIRGTTGTTVAAVSVAPVAAGRGASRFADRVSTSNHLAHAAGPTQSTCGISGATGTTSACAVGLGATVGQHNSDAALAAVATVDRLTTGTTGAGAAGVAAAEVVVVRLHPAVATGATGAVRTSGLAAFATGRSASCTAAVGIHRTDTSGTALATIDAGPAVATDRAITGSRG